MFIALFIEHDTYSRRAIGGFPDRYSAERFARVHRRYCEWAHVGTRREILEII